MVRGRFFWPLRRKLTAPVEQNRVKGKLRGSRVRGWHTAGRVPPGWYRRFATSRSEPAAPPEHGIDRCCLLGAICRQTASREMSATTNRERVVPGPPAVPAARQAGNDAIGCGHMSWSFQSTTKLADGCWFRRAVPGAVVAAGH